jgi:hypothetical protein
MRRTGFKRKTLDEVKATQATKRAKRPLGASKPKKRIKSTRSTKKKPKKPKISKLKKLLWEECRRITFLRYPEPKCYTCEKFGITGSNCHLGHFIPSSVCSVEMRYSLDNLRFQCYSCNIFKSGNWPAYEAHLIIEKGRDFPELLKQRNEETKNKQYDITWYMNKLDEYKNELS